MPTNTWPFDLRFFILCVAISVARTQIHSHSHTRSFSCPLPTSPWVSVCVWVAYMRIFVHSHDIVNSPVASTSSVSTFSTSLLMAHDNYSGTVWPTLLRSPSKYSDTSKPEPSRRINGHENTAQMPFRCTKPKKSESEASKRSCVPIGSITESTWKSSLSSSYANDYYYCSHVCASVHGSFGHPDVRWVCVGSASSACVLTDRTHSTYCYILVRACVRVKCTWCEFRSTLSDRNQSEILFFLVSFYCILLDSRSFSVEFFVVPAFVGYSVEHVAVVRGTKNADGKKNALLRLATENFFVPLEYSQWVVCCGASCLMKRIFAEIFVIGRYKNFRYARFISMHRLDSSNIGYRLIF